jgi:RNA polymerase sigma-B factor
MTEHGEYAHLVPLHHRYAQLAPGDPGRERVREQLINGYLPVAEHIARRFIGRGEPLEDLVQVATVGLINAVDRFDPAAVRISFPSRYRRSPARYAGTSVITVGRPGCRAG